MVEEVDEEPKSQSKSQNGETKKHGAWPPLPEIGGNPATLELPSKLGISEGGS
jgi:hypothetical protein